ncbi:MAG TPA: hypothetical protein VEG39_00550 [Clostridia bacterium]|nr:hypothetical protein [Clostridia bacterium]
MGFLITGKMLYEVNRYISPGIYIDEVAAATNEGASATSSIAQKTSSIVENANDVIGNISATSEISVKLTEMISRFKM